MISYAWKSSYQTVKTWHGISIRIDLVEMLTLWTAENRCIRPAASTICQGQQSNSRLEDVVVVRSNTIINWMKILKKHAVSRQDHEGQLVL